MIKALILREMHTRYGRENIGLLWLIIEPMLLASMIGLLHARGGRIHEGDIQPLPMSIIGYCNFMIFRSIFNRGEGAIESNLPLMYHRTVKPLDILLARALLDTVGIWLAFIILMSVAISLSMTHVPVRPGLAAARHVHDVLVLVRRLAAGRGAHLRAQGDGPARSSRSPI